MISSLRIINLKNPIQDKSFMENEPNFWNSAHCFDLLLKYLGQLFIRQQTTKSWWKVNFLWSIKWKQSFFWPNISRITWFPTCWMKAFATVDTKIKHPRYYIRMYWTNICQPTVREKNKYFWTNSYESF